MRSTLTEPVAARCNLWCSKPPNRRDSSALTESWAAVAEFQSISCFDVFLSFLQATSFIAILSVIYWLATETLSAGVLVMVFNCFAKVADSTSLFSASPEQLRITFGRVDKWSLKGARPRTCSVPVMLQVTAPRNAEYSSTDPARLCKDKFDLVTCATVARIPLADVLWDVGNVHWKQPTCLNQRNPPTQTCPHNADLVQTNLRYGVWICSKGRFARSDLP